MNEYVAYLGIVVLSPDPDLAKRRMLGDVA